VVSVTDPYGRILGFLDRSRYFMGPLEYEAKVLTMPPYLVSDSIPRKINQAHTLITHSPNIHFNIIILSIFRLQNVFSFDFPTKILEAK
jgi:hypothetical protein